MYHVRRYIEELSVPFNDGAEIIYVNGSYSDESDIGKLMHDFRTSDPDRMYFKVLAESIRYFKENPKGVSEMCQVMDEFFNDGRTLGHKEGREEGLEEGRKEGREEGRKEGIEEGISLTAKRLLDAKLLSLDEISKITGLSYDKLMLLES